MNEPLFPDVNAYHLPFKLINPEHGVVFTDQLNYRLFRRKYEVDVEAYKHRWRLLPLTARGGIQDAGSLADSLRFKTVKDYEDWLARMRSFPKYMDQTIALRKEGVRQGRVHPKVVMKRVPAQIERQLVDNPEKSQFFKPFENFPEEFTDNEKQRLTAEAREAVTTQITPAYHRMSHFFNEEYLPACFDDVGVWQMPDGQELYAFQARKFTTTELTPEEIHEIGKQEVARIRGEMEEIIREVGFEGTFQEFLTDLRTNPKFYYKSPNELLEAYRAVSKTIDPQLPRLFGRLPRIPYGVQAIPEQLAPDTTTAYYRPPSADGRRPGTYFVNLYKPEVSARNTKWRRSRCTRRCPGTICRSHWRWSWKGCRSSGGTTATRRSSRAGRSTVKVSAATWVSIRTPIRSSAG